MKTPFTFRSPWFLFLSTLALAAGSACAQPSDAAIVPLPLSDAELETAFWDCDALATREVLSPSDGAQCAILSDELKQRRFDGDFARLLAWWRDNKAREHAAREEAAADAFPEP